MALVRNLLGMSYYVIIDNIFVLYINVLCYITFIC